jgi:hypothetical protein
MKLKEMNDNMVFLFVRVADVILPIGILLKFPEEMAMSALEFVEIFHEERVLLTLPPLSIR